MALINEKLKNATVGIAGLGGLGSTVAVALARAGIGKLIIADFIQFLSAQCGRQWMQIVRQGISHERADVQIAFFLQFKFPQKVRFPAIGEGDGLGHEGDFTEMGPVQRASDAFVLDQVLASSGPAGEGSQTYNKESAR